MIAPTVTILPVTNRALLKTYIHLPAKVYAGYKNWVPPIYDDEWKFHNPKQNRALQHCEVIRLLALEDAKAVGRIMGIIHHTYNQQQNEKTARFFNLDCVDSAAVAHALTNAIEGWAAAKGMDKIIGPFGFSDKDPEGVQVKGFENLPVIVTPANPPYLPGLIEAEGYTKELDCVSYRLAVPETLPAVYEKICARIEKSTQLHLVELTTKKQMKPYVIPVLRLVNETYANIFGFVPMTEAEMKSLAAQYMFVLDPEFIKVAETPEGEIAAFIVAMPDMSRGLQKAKGKLLPFGFLHLLADTKKTKQLNLMLGAVKQQYRGVGVNVLLAKAILQAARRRGFTSVDSHLVLETNTRMCAEYANLGGQVYKRYRVYQKKLGA